MSSQCRNTQKQNGAIAATVKSERSMSNIHIYNINIKINRIRVQKLPVLYNFMN